MADHASRLTPPAADLSVEHDRVAAFLKTLERMASVQIDERLPISSRHDARGAIAHAIKALVGELSSAAARAKGLQEETEFQLRAAVASAEARNGAILRAIPDLMFVILRDGTYIDYHARDPNLLFAPPGTFLGKKVRDILPPALAEIIMDALERASQSDEPVVVEYELPLDETRAFEARIVQAGSDRLLTIVRDVTDATRASALNRELAGRLIARQESERQRIARELHDDVGQRVALLKIEIDRISPHVASEELRARLHKLSAQATEIGKDVHNLSYELHPSRLRVLGLVPALESLCRDTSRQRNLHVAFTRGEMPQPVAEDISLCLYRIVQEALHNVARHSRAHEAHVSIAYDEGYIVLQIADAGVGFDPRDVQDAGLGLVSMRERVTLAKGRLTVDAVPGGGTQITVRVPLGPQAMSSASAVPAAT